LYAKPLLGLSPGKGLLKIVAVAVRLPPEYPKDPADRIIASTAMVDGIPLVTADVAFATQK
jgi:PIN domain nuclease of toxin-antitoxin system